MQPECTSSISSISKEKTPVSSEKKPSKDTVRPEPPDCPHEAILAMYHELLPTCRKVKIWNRGREAMLRARWREHSKPNGSGEGYATVEAGLAWWRAEFFGRAARSPFLTGRAAPTGGRSQPFVASLTWLLKPENFAKVLEDHYDKREPKRTVSV
jgi:hypothetical protein